MRGILQRVTKGSVTVDDRITGEIGLGFVALVGITHSDTREIVAQIASKVANLRVFDDGDGKMNLSALTVNASVLVVSQFTLYADVRKGRRPSYTDASRPEHAEPLVAYFGECLKADGIQTVEFGIFGAMMQVEIHNDGPVTIILDSDDIL